MKPTSPATVTLCAESNTRLPASTNLSNLDTCASFALRCAARNRATFCSGVSVRIDPGPLPPGPPAPAPDRGEENRGGGVEVLELACGVVAVNRVASETLRGAADNGMVGVFRLSAFFLRCRGRQGGNPDVFRYERRPRWVEMEASERFPPAPSSTF